MPSEDNNTDRPNFSAQAVESLLETGGGMLQEISDGIDSKADDALAERWIGSTIGPYRVVALVASGGMALVFRAERDDGQFEQVVAIKVLRTSLPDELGRRFDEERRLLARLQHVGIAKILDGGVVNGDLWIAMEFVDGRSIDTYCDEERLTIVERLAMFVRIAKAVRHAHTKLVVHRDIKPSNILVDAAGQPKLLDFGIARPLSGDFDTGETRAFDLLTPQYATPEQVHGEPIGVASDTYQLGLLLYLLLTGQLAQEVEHSSMTALKASVIDRVPLKPSQRILHLMGTNPEAADCAGAARGTDALNLQKKLQGDLDAIVGKCLEKDPSRRYETVTELIDDVEAFLECRPVKVQYPSVYYRSVCFMKRHRGGVIAGLLTVIVLLTSLTMVALSWRSTLQAQSTALAEAHRAQQVGEFLSQMLERVDPWNSGADGMTARELLDKSRGDIDSLAEHPDVQAELLMKFGSAYDTMGAYESAENAFADAAELWERIGDHNQTVVATTRLAYVNWELNDVAEARRYLREAGEMLESSTAIEPENVAYVHFIEALMLYTEGKFAEQLELLEQVVVETEGRESPLAFDLGVAARMRMIPNAWRLNDTGRQEALIAELDQSMIALPDTSPAVRAIMIQHKSRLWRSIGDTSRAENLMQQAIQLLIEVFGEEHARTAYARMDHADMLLEQDRWAEADREYRQGAAVSEKVYAARPSSTQYTYGALMLDHIGRFDAARDALEKAESLVQEDVEAAEVALYRAMLPAKERRFSAAVAALDAVLPGAIEKSHRHYRTVVDARIALAWSLLEIGELQRAEQALQALLAESRAYKPYGLPGEGRVLQGLAKLAYERGDVERGIAFVNQSIERLPTVDGGTTPAQFDALLLKGELLAKGEPTSLPAFIDSIDDAASQALNSESIQQQYRLTRLGALLTAAGQTDRAETICARASDAILSKVPRTHALAISALENCIDE